MRNAGRWIKDHPWLILGAFVLLNAFVRNASTPLWDQDEAAYAGFARHMLHSGDWVVPEFMWSAPHRKPPFLIWAIAVSMKLFGESEFAIRLPTALATVAIPLSLWWLSRPLVGERVARLASLVMATSELIPNMGKIAFTDSWLLLFEMLAVLALWRAVEAPSWRWTLLFWTAMAFGLLTKGPPVVIVAGGLFCWLLVTHPRRRNLLKLHPWIGLPLALAPLLCWGWLAWERTNGEIIRWMLDWYIVRRARGGTVFGQYGPPGYHLLVMLVGLFPWSFLLWPVLRRLPSRWTDAHGRVLIGWLVFGWFVWELMPSKLFAYAVGAYPAMAILLAEEVEQLDREDLQRLAMRLGAWTGVLVSAAFTLTAVGIAVLGHLGTEAMASAGLFVVISVLGTWSAARALRERSTARLMTTLSAAGLACPLLVWGGLMPAFNQARSVGKVVAEVIDRESAPGSTVFYARNFRLPSMAFYVGRNHPEQLEVPSEAELQEKLRTATAAVFVLSDETYQHVRDSLAGSSITRVDGLSLDRGRTETLWVACKQPTHLTASRAPH